MVPIHRSLRIRLLIALPLISTVGLANAADKLEPMPPTPGPALDLKVGSLDRMQVYAAQAMADAIEARAALHDSNLIELDADLTKVQVMLELIRARLPGAEFLAMARAMRAKMHFEDNQQVQPFFSHLFYALDDLGNGKAVAQARKYLTQAQRALAIPNRADAIAALRKAVGVFENPYVSPPLKAADSNLNQALAALNTTNNTVSDSLLKALVGHLDALHRAFATYPLDMQPHGPSSQD